MIIGDVQIRRRRDYELHLLAIRTQECACTSNVALHHAALKRRKWGLITILSARAENRENVTLRRHASLFIPPTDRVCGLRADRPGHPIRETKFHAMAFAMKTA